MNMSVERLPRRSIHCCLPVYLPAGGLPIDDAAYVLAVITACAEFDLPADAEQPDFDDDEIDDDDEEESSDPPGWGASPAALTGAQPAPARVIRALPLWYNDASCTPRPLP